ncbi:Methylated-DNA--protein-cysteine methyltransferase (EC 2.1.1.63) [uncultured Gammaproteobacteria bacterium]|nr:Methylated-DNA--protein-cysteine methyltransferase (EC 2.1.1.63) [uncultured Gammaproteobacteria bacterium]
MKHLTFDEKYALIKANSLSQYITAVVTTGIFCRASCRAKKPKVQNVVFYDSQNDAIKAGFRPCKICKPMGIEGKTPDYVEKIIHDLQNDPYLKIKDYDLRKRGIEPNKIRRWFKVSHNMTFHAYQRMFRINKAYNQIKGGNSITNTAFGLGYESLSSFNQGWKKLFGTSDKKTNKIVINIIRFPTKIGTMFACATTKGLCLLEFSDRRMLETEFKDLCARLNAVILPGSNPYLDLVQIQIAEYLDGKRKNFDLDLHMVGTDFQRQVWQTLLKIPYGKTWSYKYEAEFMHKPSAIRAVASANGCNKIGLIVPCHRVIASDGSLGGYGGGLDRKQFLLTLENNNN